MKPFHWQSKEGNFGDDLNLWLWDILLPGLRDVHPHTTLIGIGTVLNQALQIAGERKLVIGSGCGYGKPPNVMSKSCWDVRCVRGPLTAQALDLDPGMGIIDPAVMVSDLPEFQNLHTNNRTVFIPHWESAVSGIWPLACEQAGLYYLDPRGEAKSVIRELAQSQLVLAESMHGAIIADAFRVPWIPVTTSKVINAFKWNDWTQSIGVSYNPRHIPVSTRAEATAKGERFWGFHIARSKTPPCAHTIPPRNFVSGCQFNSSPAFNWKIHAKLLLATPSVLALRRAGKAKPQLSQNGILAQRKEQLLEVLAGVRRDYF
jgi:succinoglycan biosynthesis protein ExoV